MTQLTNQRVRTYLKVRQQDGFGDPTLDILTLDISVRQVPNTNGGVDEVAVVTGKTRTPFGRQTSSTTISAKTLEDYLNHRAEAGDQFQPRYAGWSRRSQRKFARRDRAARGLGR